MKEELQQKLMQWVETLGDVVSEQLPDFAMQIVAYKILVSMVWMCAGISVCIFLGVVILLLLIALPFDCALDRSETLSCIGCVFLVSIIPFCVAIGNYVMIKKCEVAPKIVIVDYIRSG